jgi:hypothetical protein
MTESDRPSIPVSALKHNRRTILAGLGAMAVPTALSGVAHAQAKLAPPNLISAGKMVMSINPTLPPLQYVDDREFKVYMDDSVFTTIRTQTNIGDTHLNVVNSDNFPQPGGGSPATVTISNAGTGYAAQDLLTLTGGNNNFQILVLTQTLHIHFD